MRIAKLKKASCIEQVLQELDREHTDRFYHDGFLFIERHIKGKYERACRAGLGADDALRMAKQCVVSANGGTSRQWHAV